jgi:hypothetical protein
MRNISKIVFGIMAILLIAGNAAAPGFKVLRLSADRGTYIEGSGDDWLKDSTVISGETQFTTEIGYKWDGNAQNKPVSIDGTHLILTTNLDPSISGIQVTLANMRYDDLGATGISDKTIAAADWTQFPTDTSICDADNSGLTCYNYQTAPHGILTSPNYYVLVRLDDLSDNQVLLDDYGNGLLVDITSTADPSKGARLHIDSIGTNIVPIETCTGHGQSETCSTTYPETGVVGNPYSSDITANLVPEFSTIALPIAAVIGMVFFFQNRKKKEE